MYLSALEKVARRLAAAVGKKVVAPLLRPALEAALDSNAKDLLRMHHLRALQATAEFIDTRMRGVPSFPTRFALLDHVMPMMNPEPGLICEFGVHTGSSINYIASKVDQSVFGFDSFEGLPEDWRDGVTKGTFKVDGLPNVDPKVSLVKGWFDQTLAPFLEAQPGNARLLHVDCDLYSSTKTVFETFHARIAKGTIIAFDEFFNYPGWQDGEAKAFEEAAAAYGWQYRYLGYAAHTEQVVVQITEIEHQQR